MKRPTSKPRNKQQRYRARHRSLGLCVQCPRPVKGPGCLCPRCRAKATLRRRLYSKRQQPCTI